MKFNKKFIVIGGAVAFVVIGIAASKPPQETFKNLKVLPKDISEQRLDSVMNEFEKALGVGCDFCHGLHRHERCTGRSSHRHRNACRHIMYYSCITLRGSISPRAIRDCDVHHVHAFSDQFIDVAQFFGAGDRICDSRL